MAEPETPPIEVDEATELEPVADESEFDKLVNWADGITDSSDFIEGHLKEATTVQAGAQILASRINSNRMASLMKALQEADDVLIERLPGMDTAELLIAKKGLEESMEKTSLRIHNPTGIRTVGGGGVGGVNIFNNQQTALATPAAPQNSVLNQESRMKVRQLVAKVKSDLKGKGEVIDVESVERETAPAAVAETAAETVPTPKPKPTPAGTNAS